MRFLFKIAGLIFGWKSQVEYTKSKYTKNLGERIGAMVVLFLFIGASLACEFWMISAFKENIALGILALIFLCAVGGATVKLLMVYSSVALSAARDAKREEKEAQQAELLKQTEAPIEHINNDIVTDEQPHEDIPQIESYKPYKRFDRTMGIIYMLLALGLLTTLILIPVLELKAAANS